MTSIPDNQRREIQKRLVAWFNKFQRGLPWRKNYDPYQVWISEIMLQQTQVKTALPYFDRWMRALPDIQSVAEASEDKILKLWEGLGYYSRARNLHKAAKAIMERHGGLFPEKFEDILALPGIGRYTAGAIASIAFRQNRPLVDGNVIRVLSRLFGFRKNTKKPENIEKFWRWAEDLIPQGLAREFNQGMMELGALVCSPSSPKCDVCPLKMECVGKKLGIQELLPDRGPLEKKENIHVSVAVIRHKGKIFIQKRPSRGLMGGLWEFPGGKMKKGESELEALHREIKEDLGVSLKSVRMIHEIRHGYTKFSVDLHCFSAHLGEGKIRTSSATEGKWVSPKSLDRYAFPAANRKLINKLKKGPIFGKSVDV